MKRIWIAPALLLSLCPALGAGEHAQAALELFAQASKDKGEKLILLATIKGTDEKEALSIFVALGQSKDDALRRLAPQGIMDLADEDQAAKLLRSFLDDSNPSIRSETLIYLSRLDALSAQDLVPQLQSDSYDLKCIAARCLVKMGQGQLARETLEALAYTGAEIRGEPDLATRVMSATALLAMGQQRYHDPLKKKLTSPRTSGSVQLLALAEMEDLAVTAGVDIAEAIGRDDRMELRVRLQAYKTLLKTAPEGPKRLVKEILTAEDMIVPHLLHLLVEQGQDPEAIRMLAGRPGLLGTLARFERARAGASSQDVARLAGVVLEINQPIAIEYVLGRARKDLEENKPYAKAYDGPLLKLLESIREAGTPRGPDVQILQQTVALLADIATDRALLKLQHIFSERYDAFQATAASGLPRARNEPVTVIARHLLKSPYERISTYAAFTMGKFAKPQAAKPLRSIVSQPERYRLSLRILAGWYLLKIDGQSASGADAIGRMVR